MSVIHKVSYMVVSFVLCALSAGCGRTDESSAQTEPPAQWKTQGFAISQSDAENRELNIKEYLPWEHGEVYNAEEGISEELEIMYEENRTPKDAAEVIKNRVQVYLDEGE